MSTVRRSVPTKSTASAVPSEKANSPASVEGMLPPHIEFASMKMKGSVPSAASAGPGNGTAAKRSERYAHTGSRNVPSCEPSLKATLSGIT